MHVTIDLPFTDAARRRASALLAALALAVLLVPSALAHAELVTADPAPDAVVTGVERIVATFSQDLDAERSSMQLRDASGAVVAEGGRDADDVRTMSIPATDLAPGVYEVRWTTFSTEDDELHRGTYTFEVAAAPASVRPTPSPTGPATAIPTPTPTEPPATPTPTPDPTPTPTAGDGAGPAPPDASDVLVPIAAGAVVLVLFGVSLLRRGGPGGTPAP